MASPSVKDCPRTDASTQTEEFDYLFTHSSTSKPFDQNYFGDDNAKVSFYTGLPTYEVLESTFSLFPIVETVNSENNEIIPC